MLSCCAGQDPAPGSCARQAWGPLSLARRAAMPRSRPRRASISTSCSCVRRVSMPCSGARPAPMPRSFTRRAPTPPSCTNGLQTPAAASGAVSPPAAFVALLRKAGCGGEQPWWRRAVSGPFRWHSCRGRCSRLVGADARRRRQEAVHVSGGDRVGPPRLTGMSFRGVLTGSAWCGWAHYTRSPLCALGASSALRTRRAPWTLLAPHQEGGRRASPGGVRQCRGTTARATGRPLGTLPPCSPAGCLGTCRHPLA